MDTRRHYIKSVAKADRKFFPNGFTSWQEVHYEVTLYLMGGAITGSHMGYTEYEEGGTVALYRLAEFLTDKFEITHVWKDDYTTSDRIYDALQVFLADQEEEYKKDYQNFYVMPKKVIIEVR
jgi:hypothetical protein